MDLLLQAEVRELVGGKSLVASRPLLATLAGLRLGHVESGGRVALSEPIELLDPDAITAMIAVQSVSPDHRQVDVLWSVDSTNTWLLDKSQDAAFHGRVCLAEQQTAGKGRRGRTWVSPFGRNIYLSIGWRFSAQTRGVGGLSLAIGIAVVHALRAAGIDGVGLKWPNDILRNHGKLGGILIELTAVRRGEIKVVVGIGINLYLDATDAVHIGQAASVAGVSLSRNQLAAGLINHVLAELSLFETQGFSPYQNQWQAYDVYADQPVVLTLVDRTIHGINRGVDGGGNLRLETGDGMLTFNAGEVSFRPVAD
jgi:BirA family transcriptional regulator, biotin operon repressor / biotin---[acetyl-CoA-carboxylase] ligase